MSVPDVSTVVRDGALGAIPPAAPGTCLKAGTCQSGTVGTVYSFADPQIAVNTLGQGPLTESVVRSLGAGGSPCLAVPVNSSVSATVASPATKVGTGACVVSITGTPFDAYQLKLLVVAPGVTPSAGTATFQYSLDGGTTYSPIIAVPTAGTYVIPNTGLTLSFSAAALVALDTYTSACTAPGFSLSDLVSAITSALASSFSFGFIHAVGPAASVSAAAAMLAGVDTLMAAAMAAYRYIFTVIEVPQDTDTNIMAAFASSSSTRVMAAAGFATVASAVNGRQLSRSAGWVISERISSVRPGVDLGRVSDGSLPGVVSISRDERATPGLDDARFATLRTIIGRNGFYINNGRMMSPAGSDYSLVQYRRVMDVFSSTGRQALLNFLNSGLLVDPVTGFILEADARNIETYTEELCRDAITRPGDGSALTITVNRATNIISTANLPVTGRVVPLGYAKFITLDLGLSNPALQLKAA